MTAAWAHHALDTGLTNLPPICRSVHKFATEFANSKQPLHCLVNNAGEFVPEDKMTEDGFEITVGTNHFGA